MPEKPGATLSINRRVFSRVHFKYSLEEQKDIWRCMWLAEQMNRFVFRAFLATAGGILVSFMAWAPQTPYWGVRILGICLSSFALVRAIMFVRKAHWYRLRAAVMIHGGEGILGRRRRADCSSQKRDRGRRSDN